MTEGQAMTIRVADGRELKGKEVSYEPIEERWSVFRLEDGTTVRVRPVVVKMFRAVDEEGNPALTEEGEPLIIVRHRIDIVASAGG